MGLSRNTWQCYGIKKKPFPAAGGWASSAQWHAAGRLRTQYKGSGGESQQTCQGRDRGKAPSRPRARDRKYASLQIDVPTPPQQQYSKQDMHRQTKKEAYTLLQGAGLQVPRGLPRDGFFFLFSYRRAFDRNNGDHRHNGSYLQYKNQSGRKPFGAFTITQAG